MKRLCVIMMFLLNAIFVFSQIATYKSENGHVVNVSVTPSYTMFQIDGNEPFSMTMGGMSNGWYMYLSPTGNICVSVDLQSLMIISGNPPSQLLFKLANMSSGPSDYTMPSTPNQYQSGRSKAQIQTDINHTERLMNDARSNQSNDQSISGQIGYNGIIQRYEQRLRELYQELSNASY